MRKAAALRSLAAIAVSAVGFFSALGGPPEGTRSVPSPSSRTAAANVAEIPSPPEDAGVGEWREYLRRRRVAADAARREAASAKAAAAVSARERAERERKFEEAREDPVMLMSEREVREARLAKLEEERRALARRLALLEALSAVAEPTAEETVGAARTRIVDDCPASNGRALLDSSPLGRPAPCRETPTVDDDALYANVDLGPFVTHPDFETAQKEEAALRRRVAELRDQMRRLTVAGGDPNRRATVLDDVRCEAAWTFGAELLQLAAPGADALRRASLPDERREAFGRAFDAIHDLLFELETASPAERRKRLADAAALARDAARKAEELRNAAPLSLTVARRVSEAMDNAATALGRGAELASASNDVRRNVEGRQPMWRLGEAAALAAAFDPYAASSARSVSLSQRRDAFAEAEHALARLCLALRFEDGAQEYLAAELGEAERRLVRAQRTIDLYRAAHRAHPEEKR